MKRLVLLVVTLLVAGCGEKSSSEGSESASEKPTASNESAEPSGDTAKPAPAESPSEEPSDTPKSLSDADVERLLKEAVDVESFEKREGLLCRPNESEPYSGWTKGMHDSGQAMSLARFKNGEPHGLWTEWHENGQKEFEENYKDGVLDGPYTLWHKNGQKKQEGTMKDGELEGLATQWHESGQKAGEATFKDGKEVSKKYWNSKGEEVDSFEESKE